jgi:hypothetical protein
MYISDRLGGLARFYDLEAARCAKGRAYLAACAMKASALEALLQAMCFLYADEVKKTSVYQDKKFKSKRYRALEFRLYDLINIADQLSWFPSKRITWGKRTTLAGFAHELRKLRNHVHPSVWALTHPRSMKFTKGTHEVASEIADVANSWLSQRIDESLRKAMKREGLL